MELFNPTAEILEQRYDGLFYQFEPNDVLTLPEATGDFMLTKLGPRGLVQIKFDDDVKALQAEGLAARARHYAQIIHNHEVANRLQSEKKFPPLVKSKAVVMAETYLPIYQEHLEKLNPELAEREKNMAQDAARKALEAMAVKEPAEIPEDNLDALRASYKEAVGEEPNHAWNQRTLKARIRDAAKTTA